MTDYYCVKNCGNKIPLCVHEDDGVCIECKRKTLKPKWKYRSFNFGGNLHYLRDYLNDNEPNTDIVAVHVSGANCVVLCRDPVEEKDDE